MSGSIPTGTQLASAIEAAAEIAINRLFKDHPGRYYYLSLVTLGEASPPFLSAWSEEALEQAVKDQPNNRRYLKWSCSDSLFCFFGEEFFEDVRRLFAMRPDIFALDEAAWCAEYETRLLAMEAAMFNLDSRGIFGVGADRSKIVVTVEVVPPDYTNTARARRLNPPEAIRTWLEEAAEPESP